MPERRSPPRVRPGTTVVSATKGLERGSWTRMSEVLAAELPAGCPVVVLSGPSFAHEVARELPTAVVAATTDPAAGSQVLETFRGKRFRLYTTDDVARAREQIGPEQRLEFGRQGRSRCDERSGMSHQRSIVPTRRIFRCNCITP